MNRTQKSHATNTAYNLTSVFTAHRDLRTYTKLAVARSGLSLEEADILVLLYGLSELGWDDCAIDKEKFVTFRELKSILVHDPSLFGRRIKKLSTPGHGLVEVRKIKKVVDPGLHGNSMRMRITPLGIKKAKPIWEDFERLAARLFGMDALRNFSPAELEIHRKINEEISRALREWRDPARKLF